MTDFKLSEDCLERIASLEKENGELKQRIQDLETGKTEDRLSFLETQWELLHDKLGFLQSHVQKIDGEHESIKSCLNTNCQDIGKIERDSQRNAVKTDAVYKRVDEYNEHVQRLEETLKSYKKENETLRDTIEETAISVLDRKDETNKLRHRIIDVSIDMEKIEEEIKEINKNAMFRKDAVKNFQPIMERINELELALKSVSIHKSSIQQIIQRLSALENP